MTLPDWLDRNEYPFTSRTVDLDEGRVHYVDEGEGETLLMVHGTPTWSYLYRNLIRDLRRDYRVIALDKLGFGLSGKPTDFGYTPADQARVIAAFIEKLGLTDITMVVHDYGGSTGLSYALDHPQNVKRLVIFNTWMWSLRDDPQKAMVGRFLGSPLGRMLCMRFNMEVNVIFPYAFSKRSRLKQDVHDLYRQTSAHETSRHAIWMYGKELIDSSEWYDSLWAKRDAIRNIPALIVWGMKDPVFTRPYLEKWQSLFTDGQTVELADVGHYVQEEAPEEAVRHIRVFLREQQPITT
jgi:haloalkane dehalogenase